ncbi:MAG TPA: YjgN family protein [Hyphomicrobiaceae bacterium]|jgi:uncharacterized membrane protein YjgN (DUF898 family)|nr:YjgN family protein [Hyphomicrobiaceae bacterium]
MTFADASAGLGPAPVASKRIAWVPPASGLLGLSLLNGLLRVLTLGIYHFWGKAEVRQRIWSAVRIDGEPVEYRGTGGELFRGFLMVFVLVLLPLGTISLLGTVLMEANNPARGGAQILFWALISLLWGLGIHRARRYRLSRTRWRGIRAGLTGSSGHFAWSYWWTLLLVPLTLGWIVPWRTALLQRILMNETCFGDKAFTFEGRAGPLYRRFWLLWLGTIVLALVAFGLIGYLSAQSMRPGAPYPMSKAESSGIILGILLVGLLLFGILRAWYGAGVLNYFASQTRYGDTRFTLRATVPSLIGLTVGNYLLRVLTLGTLTPIAEARSMRYIVERLSLEGATAWEEVGQNRDALLQSGEGLAEAFNVDAF